MKRTHNQNKSLYESIMRDVAKTVKRRLNEDDNNSFYDSNESNDKRVSFGPSYPISELKDPSKQQEICHTLSNFYPENAGERTFYYSSSRNVFVLRVTIENPETDEKETTLIAFRTIYHAAIYSTAITFACLNYTDDMILVNISGTFNVIQKLIMRAISPQDFNACETIQHKMEHYLEQKLPQATTFEEKVEIIKKACHIL